MKIFLTGGTGFIGSHFLQYALSAGYEIVAQRRPGSSARIQLTREPVWVDRSLDSCFQDELAGCDAVVHLASHTPNPPYAPLDECLYWNVYAPVNLLRQAVAQGVKSVIISGTYFEYGLAAIGQEFVHPATEMRPTLTYPTSKAAATTAFLGLARQYELRLQVLRLFQVFGEGESESRFWPSLRSAALSGRDFHMSAGTQVRDFVPVLDVVGQLVGALESNDVNFGQPQIRNVGTGIGKSLYEFASEWWVKWGAAGHLIPGQLPFRPGELPRVVADIKAVHIC